MKRSLFFTIAMFGLAVTASAQQGSFDPDQNPRARESAGKYSRMIDSLTSDQGATVQNTYKAYDWYEARDTRRQERRARNAAFYNSGYYQNYGYGNSLFYPSFGGGYYNGFGNSFFAPTFRIGGRSHRFYH
ncbi:hypothetical protein [Pedobacter duraquae]|uniref:Uncharacterized protein n=1 Tax=Pedobacter duraquae TaxID=425511 RepID=A0A4R6ICH6_9SPHI|nr:hypothetical protein [Pedobacter duraquae]TDO19277.1 hypothetical protein CLV32_4516 [Pedobacter duraquae]